MTTPLGSPRPLLTTLLTTVLTLLLAATALTLAHPGAATAQTAVVGRGRPTCNEKHFIPQYRYARLAEAPIITQLSTHTFPPAAQHRVTRKADTQRVITAGAKIGGSINTKVGNKLIGQAKVELHAELAGSYQSTKRKSEQVTDVISNPTKRNKTFVFFVGTVGVSAVIERSYCKVDEPGQPNGYVYWKRAGTLNTFEKIADGAPRCGAGADDSVTREALRIGCA